MSGTMLSLQEIRAKLQQLQMQQLETKTSSANSSSLLSSSTKDSSALRTADWTDQGSTSSLHIKEKPKVASESHHARHTGASLLQRQTVQCHETVGASSTPSVVSAAQLTSSSLTVGASSTPSVVSAAQLTSSSQTVGASSTPSVVSAAQLTSSSLTRTAEFTDRNMSSNLHTAENTATFEVEDHKARMKEIEREGSSPEKWTAYIEFLKTVPSEGNIRSKPLSEAYSRAFTDILNNRDHRTEAAVRLIMDYVHFCSERFEWDTVDTILDMARGHVQGFAVIIVASAEVKILKGDHDKALSMLTKTLAKGRAQPKELLIRAIRSAEAGQSKLLSDQERNLQVSWILGHSRSQDSDESLQMPPPASGYTDSQIEMATDPGNISSSSVSAADLPLFTHPSSASKHPLRHYNSTPEVRSSTLKTSWSQLQSSKLKGIVGRPMRVRNPVQQHAVHLLNQEKEEDTDLMNSIKPFYPGHAATGRLVSLTSSGYHSDMTIPTEDSTPGQAPVSTVKDVSHSTVSATAEQNATSEHADSNKPPLPSHHPPVPAATAAAPSKNSNSALPVMSTPSCKGPQMQPVLLQTPSGEAMETVTVSEEQYCILKKVGRGGSAQVYMVLDASKNIRALKVVDLEGAGLEVVDGFRNEIGLLQRLQYCDSVIKMFNFELNEQLNRLYVVLEFGETDLSEFFSTRAKQKQGLDPMLIKFYWGEMLRAVSALHKEGIIHSDLKPANFMLVAGNLKLIDFGIANALQQDKTSVLKDSRVGTPSYMSPEAIMAACNEGGDDSAEDKENVSTRPKYKVGVRSDVWSLGCILYNMVYGRTPFQHIKNNMGKLHAITNPAYTIKFPEIPDPLLMDVLQKCLRREVKSRPTTTELLSHPYLINNEDKDSGSSHKPPSRTATTTTACSTAVSTPPDTRPVESRRLQELLKSHLVQGSPGTASAVKRVMDLLQQVETGK